MWRLILLFPFFRSKVNLSEAASWHLFDFSPTEADVNCEGRIVFWRCRDVSLWSFLLFGWSCVAFTWNVPFVCSVVVGTGLSDSSELVEGQSRVVPVWMCLEPKILPSCQTEPLIHLFLKCLNWEHDGCRSEIGLYTCQSLVYNDCKLNSY